MRLVVDASALLAVAHEAETEGVGAAAAREVLEWHNVFDVAAPALAAYEVANVVHHKWAKRGGGDPEARRSLVLHLLAFVNLIPPDPSATARIGALAERFALSAYDAAYLELVDRDPDSVFVTQDRVLRRKAAELLGEARVWALPERHQTD